uniref:Uncharacterized protein n=1 Tax=Rhizophora mucronata TaxID=61149 RepID=A0A2P2Q9D3_RHIMU
MQLFVLSSNKTSLERYETTVFNIQHYNKVGYVGILHNNGLILSSTRKYSLMST